MHKMSSDSDVYAGSKYAAFKALRINSWRTI